MPHSLAECFGGARELAVAKTPPFGARTFRWWREEVAEIHLGSMFARIAVRHSEERYDIELHVIGRDRKVKRFEPRLVGTELTLTGAPLHDGRKNQAIMPYNCLEVMLVIPSATILTVGDMAGSLGIARGLETLQLQTRYPLHLYTRRVGSVTGTFGGEGLVTIDEVEDPNSHIEVTGSGQIQLDKQLALLD